METKLRINIAIYLILILIAFLPYINSLKNPLVWDDTDLIFNDPNIAEIKNIPKFFTKSYWRYEFPSRKNTYRPLRAISFTLDYLLWKRNSFGYHFTNVMLNVIAVIVTYIFAKIISNSFVVGFLTATIFSVLPIHVEAVTWVKNRSEIFSYIFIISSLIFFVKYKFKKTENNIVNFLLSIFFFILALMSKENSVVLPLLILLILMFYCQKLSFKDVLESVVYFIVLALYVLYNYSNFKMEIGNTCSISIFSKDFMIIPTTIYEYIKILLWPFPLNPERDFDIPNRLLSSALFIPVIFVLLTIFLSKEEIRNKKFKYGFALSFVLITFLPIVNILNLESRPIAEQRLYLPSFGFSYLLGNVFDNTFSQTVEYKTISVVLLLCFVLFNGFMTFSRNYDWRDITQLLEKAVQASPFNARARTNLAIAYRHTGKFDRAIEILESLVELAPEYTNGLLSLGRTYQEVGRYKEAIDVYEKVLKLNSKMYQALNELGMLYLKTNEYKKAIEVYKKALEISPSSEQLHYNLAVAYEKAGMYKQAVEEYEIAAKYTKNKAQYYTILGTIYENNNEIKKAKEFYEKAIKFSPDYILAMYNLGLLLAKTGEYSEALDWFLKVEQNLPTNVDNLNNIGIVYNILGDSDKAMSYFNKAISINPNDPKAYYNRAQVWLKFGKKELAKKDLKKVLELEPGNKMAKLGIRKLEIGN